MLTVSKLARRFGLSRSTLLYYDRIGLLRPSGRTEAGYRIYAGKDESRLERICAYRQAGLPLAEIRRVLGAPAGELATALEGRLEELNEEIQRLRGQQKLIVGLLKQKRALAKIGVMNKQQWVSLLEASGFTEEDMDRWHVEFERGAPEKHQQFLEFLCIPDEEIQEIRAWSRQQG
ncbi:MAG: MerR family transcriptional regulator [bacterium]|nr:MerR family transcriptional regulator [bacterium]